MSKKNFRADIASGADRFFSVNDVADARDDGAVVDIRDTADTRDMEASKDTQQYYRINLKLRAEYKDFLADEAWRQRISITELLNRMIGAYKETGG